ncbi:MAG: DUF7305 domain-containing protein [Terriglobales bacterium]
MPKTSHRDERGVALFVAILALLLLTAVAAGMMYLSSTETAISSNFKSEETAYFAARAGVEEVRDRMLPTSVYAAPYSIAPQIATLALPPGNPAALYVLSSGVTMANVTNAAASNPYFDAELCHDLTIGSMTQSTSANIRCGSLPSGSSWYPSTQPASVAPVAMDYKWVRVTLKANNSNTAVPVNGSSANANVVCWNGTSEVTAASTATAACNALTPIANPVYLITALAVTSSGARRMVQEEMAQTPTGGNPGGLFATGTGCSALNLAGNASTGSFNSATEGTPTNPPNNKANSGGNVGSNGNVSLGGSSTSVNGSISTFLPPTVGSCPASGVSKSGNPTYGSVVGLPSLYTPPIPPIPNPLPPQTSTTYKGVTLTPGSYGNVTMKGTVTLQGGTAGNPAVYTFNSLTLNGNADMEITGPVVINLAGQPNMSSVLDMTGGGFGNSTYVPSNLVINYGGTGSMTITGGTSAYAVINAPNSAITLRGGANFYGQAIGKTIDDQGGTNFYWDASLGAPPSNGNSFYAISMRELSY